MKSGLLDVAGWGLRFCFRVSCWITYIISGFSHRHLVSFNHSVKPCWAPPAPLCIPSLVLGIINTLARPTRQAFLCMYPVETTRVCRFRARGGSDRLHKVSKWRKTFEGRESLGEAHKESPGWKRPCGPWQSETLSSWISILGPSLQKTCCSSFPALGILQDLCIHK